MNLLKIIIRFAVIIVYDIQQLKPISTSILWYLTPPEFIASKKCCSLLVTIYLSELLKVKSKF